MKITERGWPGHYCLASRCAFHRNTLIEHDGVRIVVSSVGDLQLQYVRREIGPGWFYETMAFHAEFDEPYMDSDVSREVRIESKLTRISEVTRMSDFIANENHEIVVREMVERILKGEFIGCHNGRPQ